MKLVDMSRGKPSPEQLSLSDAMFSGKTFLSEGIDVRNYGMIDGLPAARRFFSPILQSPADNIISFGNASLTLMYLYMRWIQDSYISQKGATAAKCIALTPGYDRHFAICEELGIELISVPLLPTGPNIEKIKEILVNEESVIGMWCVPKFSNPSGITYTEQSVQECAQLGKYSNPYFTIFWDNAYGVHGFSEAAPPLASIFTEAQSLGTQDHIAIFGSTSKITFAGGGIAAMALSRENKSRFLKHLAVMSIGPDKIAQLRTTEFLPNEEALELHMAKHAALLVPKFQVVLNVFEEKLKGLKGVYWSTPAGGYFISLNLPSGTAKAVRERSLLKGITLTPAGAAYPYGIDPEDSHLRIAPSFPEIDEISHAAAVICESVIEVLNDKTE